MEVDIQDFDPEDMDIKVEGGYLIMAGRREVVRGNSTSVRQGVMQQLVEKREEKRKKTRLKVS